MRLKTAWWWRTIPFERLSFPLNTSFLRSGCCKCWKDEERTVLSQTNRDLFLDLEAGLLWREVETWNFSLSLKVRSARLGHTCCWDHCREKSRLWGTLTSMITLPKNVKKARILSCKFLCSWYASRNEFWPVICPAVVVDRVVVRDSDCGFVWQLWQRAYWQFRKVGWNCCSNYDRADVFSVVFGRLPSDAQLQTYAYIYSYAQRIAITNVIKRHWLVIWSEFLFCSWFFFRVCRSFFAVRSSSLFVSLVTDAFSSSMRNGSSMLSPSGVQVWKKLQW